MSKIELIEWGWWTLWRIIFFTKSQLIIINPICQYWVGQKVSFGFTIRYYGNELSCQLVASQQLLDSCLIKYQTLYPISSAQLLSRVQLFATPWTAACQASLSITNSRSPPKPISLSRWCHPAISSSVVPFSCPQSFPASGSFPISQLFTSGGQSIGVSAWTSVLPMNTQDWSPLGWTGWI